MSFAKLLAVAPILAALSACAPSSFVTDRSRLITGDQRAVLNNKPNASIVRNRYLLSHNYAVEPHADRKRSSSFGIASFYTEGQQTANGEKYDPRELTAASRTLPFGTRLRVTNVANGHSVIVRINDRGPFVPRRAVDVSYSAAETLGIVERGTAKVKLDVVR